MKRKLINKIEIIGYFGYFLFLGVERLLALILSFSTGEEYALNRIAFFPIATYTITALSFIAGIILFIKPAIHMIKGFNNDEYNIQNDMKLFTISMFIFLFGGMVHTGFTLSPIQFVAYGLLIMSMICEVVYYIKQGGNAPLSIISLIYLVLYSMALPVCYYTFQEGIKMISFYLSEFVGILVLVPLWGYLFYKFMKEGTHNFNLLFLLPMLVFSSCAVILKWSEEINYFVLIFIICTTIAYLVGLIIHLASKKIESK